MPNATELSQAGVSFVKAGLPDKLGDKTTFMDHLIDSEKDVSLLRQKGIIENWMGEDKEVASLFNKNGNGVTTIYEKISDDDIKWNKVMSNATELSEAAVSFAKVNHTTNLFDIKFENGLMTIPSIAMVDSMETLMRNIIVYEQQSTDDLEYLYFSDYATFMDHLINSDKDVSLLCRKKIIVNWIGEDKEVASLFNKIGNGVIVYSNFYYKQVFTKAVKHCDEKPWNRMKAQLF
ncbi:uncharacterized protein LOC125851941 [Solanum stenotomum]|uniref:uncharacterized protein LOC125851941 n=1 Tax=Solanum stenotomum TaxID=172797 RepID=UPI0020D02BE3|nr:uncharacterized protein LOC125851941 [Solanum stenotomum]